MISTFLARKIDLEPLKEHFFKNNTKSKLFLLQKALSTLNFHENNRVVFMKLTKQDFINTDSTFEDSIGIVNHGVEIKGVDIAIITIKQADNSYYVSLRSKNNINVGTIAEQLGGGGHEHVAALQYDGPLPELRDKLLKACREELAKHPADEISPDNLFSDNNELDN